MKLFLFLSFLCLTANSAFAQGPKTSFLHDHEAEEIEFRTLGNTTVAVLEDFIAFSESPAVVIAIENNLVLVKRDEKMALLVPRDSFDEVSNASPFVVLADSCAAQCAGAAAGGALTGAVGGAGSLGSAGGMAAGAPGAAGGIVIGGIVGGVGGGITGFEVCKWATGCAKTDSPEGADGKGPK